MRYRQPPLLLIKQAEEYDDRRFELLRKKNFPRCYRGESNSFGMTTPAASGACFQVETELFQASRTGKRSFHDPGQPF